MKRKTECEVIVLSGSGESEAIVMLEIYQNIAGVNKRNKKCIFKEGKNDLFVKRLKLNIKVYLK